jgi:hypothetical protein
MLTCCMLVAKLCSHSLVWLPILLQHLSVVVNGVSSASSDGNPTIAASEMHVKHQHSALQQQ